MANGRKTGGRAKGTPNKITAKREAEIKATGLTPLDYMLSILRDKKAPVARRDDMAKAAAPYVHPKLATVDVNGNMKHSADDALTQLLTDIATNGKRVHDK